MVFIPRFSTAGFQRIIFLHAGKLCTLFLLVAFFSCNYHASDKENDRVFDRADKLLKNKESKQALRLFDSLNNATGDKDGYFKFRSYAFWKEYYYSREINDSNSLYNDSIIYAIENYNLAKRLPAEYGNALNNKGNRYYEKNEFDSAFHYYYKSKSIADELKDTCVISDQLYHMAMVSYRQERFADAIMYFKQALTGNNACKVKRMVFYRREELINNVALSFSKMQNSDSALFYYSAAQAYVNEFAAQNPDDTDISKFARLANGVIYTNLATELMSSHKYDEAAALLIKAIDINSFPRYDSLDVTYGRLELAKIYIVQNKLKEAADLLQLVDQQIDRLPGRIIRQERVAASYAYYKKTNNATAALAALEKLNNLKDSADANLKKLKQVDFPQILKDQEMRYQLNLLKKDNQLSKLTNWITLGIIAVAIVIVILVVGNYRRSVKSVATLTSLNSQISEQKVQQDITMEALMQSNRDMDRILHVVAHDLRSPVSAIMMMTDLIADEIADPSHKEIIAMIAASSKSQLALIAELLEFSGNSTDHATMVKENTDINELCKQAAALLYFKAGEKKQRIDVTLAPVPVLVNCAREKINRVINNLVTNAIKFSPEESVIAVALRKKALTVVIEIQDSGIGIPEKYKSILFDSFTTAKRYGTSGEKSFGLGLSICKQIIEAHNGKIWFESEEGKGSTFFVELPLADQ